MCSQCVCVFVCVCLCVFVQECTYRDRDQHRSVLCHYVRYVRVCGESESVRERKREREMCVCVYVCGWERV